MQVFDEFAEERLSYVEARVLKVDGMTSGRMRNLRASLTCTTTASTGKFAVIILQYRSTWDSFKSAIEACNRRWALAAGLKLYNKHLDMDLGTVAHLSGDSGVVEPPFSRIVQSNLRTGARTSCADGVSALGST